LYALDGGVVFITKVKRNFKHLIGGKLGFIIVKKPESYDIDSIEDLKLCEKTKINFS
jgi:CMP-N-acetylneuraminic acid synthetase